MIESLIEFPRSMYIERSKKVRDLLMDSGIDALFLTNEENIFYFSGVRFFPPGVSYTRPSFLVLPRDSDPILLVHENHLMHAKLSTWIKDVRSYSEMNAAPLDSIIQMFKDSGVLNSKIAAELGYEQRINMPYITFRNLEMKISNQFIDGSHIIWRLRMKKMGEEIDCIKTACRILGKAYRELFESIVPGMSELEVASLMRATICRLGGERPSFIVLSTAIDSNTHQGISEFSPHTLSLMTRPPLDRRIKSGELIWIDSGVVYKGYNSDFSRIFVLGKPSDRQARMYKLVKQLTRECISFIRPGVKCSDVVKFCNKWLKSSGLDVSFEHGRIGHGVGLLVTEPPHIGIYDDTTIEPGMVLTIEPGITTDYGTFHLEENIVVRETGEPEIISPQEDYFLYKE
ncbi:MAG: Xaa-Pro peptidase family protein [Nitrososphaerota archaeon]